MIQIENVYKSFEGKVLFNDLSVEITDNGRLLILGESGSGKTTLLRMLLGFVLPDDGKIIIDGEKLSLENVWKVRRKMAYVSQEMHLGTGSAEKFIKEVLSYKNNRQITYNRAKVLELLNDFRLDANILTKNLGEFSGGELQRFTIIVTLLLNRKIYLLDEVTSALDQPMKELIVNYFSSMKDKTLIISSHDSLWHNQNYPTLKIGNNGSSS